LSGADHPTQIVRIRTQTREKLAHVRATGSSAATDLSWRELQDLEAALWPTIEQLVCQLPSTHSKNAWWRYACDDVGSARPLILTSFELLLHVHSQLDYAVATEKTLDCLTQKQGTGKAAVYIEAARRVAHMQCYVVRGAPGGSASS
jgi:hypothetical protein